MAEGIKEEIKKEETRNPLPTILKVLLGLVFLVLGLVALVHWWPVLLMLIKGCVGPFLILAGIVTLAIAKD